MTDWIRGRKRIYWYDQYANNEQDTAFSEYDPDRIVAELAGTGADIVAVYAANQFGIAYYPSAIWPQHPNLKGRDYVGDLASRLKKAGKRVLLYINWLDSKHPEWCARFLTAEGIQPPTSPQRLASWATPNQPEGRVQSLAGGAWQVPCVNSPKREQVAALARELCDRYRPDAFHLDMFLNYGICACDFCRPDLERICGTADLTLDAVYAHWPEYVDWRCERSATVLAAVSAVCRERGIVTAHNGFVPLHQPAVYGVDRAWLDAVDVWLSECYDAFGVADVNVTSVTVRWQHAVGKPSWILRTSTPLHYAHWPITDAQWRLHAAACKANGADVFGPCGVGARPDTTTSPRLLRGVKNGFDEFMRDADLHAGAQSIARVALVFSWATRKYFAPRADLAWSDELFGWARMLIEEHIPFDIVSAEDGVPAASLERYALVILPNAANLSEAACRALREYAEGGGRLLATAESSLGDERGRRLADFRLADVFGIRSLGAFTGHLAVDRPDEPEPISGVFQRIAATRGIVRARYRATDPAGPVSGGKDPLAVGAPEWPAEVRSTSGKGECAYLASDIGRYFQLHGDPHIGAWMKRTVLDLVGVRQVETNAPRTVELTLWRQSAPERTIIHLANRTVPWTLATDARQITEILPVRDVEVRLAVPYAEPRVSCRGAQTTARVRDGRLAMEIPVLDAYAALVVEP